MPCLFKLHCLKVDELASVNHRDPVLDVVTDFNSFTTNISHAIALPGTGDVGQSGLARWFLRSPQWA